MVTAAVQASELLEVAWVSLVAGVAVTTLFSFVVLAGGKSMEARRTGRAGRATAYTSLGVLAFACFAGLVAFGVNVMLSKG